MPISIPPAAKIRFDSHVLRKLLRVILLLAGAILAALVAIKVPAGADESRTLVIPPNDGYGFEECLKAGSRCGLVVADAWCKAHGFAGSNGFGPVDKVAGTTDAPRSDIEPGSFHVTCGGRVD